MTDIELFDGGQIIKVDLNGKSCELRPIVSFSDLKIISNYDLSPNLPDYRELVAEIIANHTNGIFSSCELLELDDSIYQEYITKCVNENEQLKNHYQKISDSDVNKRFILAIEQTCNEYTSNLAEAMKSVSLPSLQLVAEESKIIVSNLCGVIEPMFQMIQDIVSSVQLTWIDNLKIFAESINKSIPDYSKLFSGISSAIQELLNGINTPTITEKQKEQLIESYETWGKLGWTLPPNAKINVFSTVPIDANDAYKRLKYCTTDECMRNVFSQLNDMNHIKKSDLKESIECYNAKHYKACCLIIFSMIDSRLIRAQLESDRNNKGQRPLGAAAAKNIFKRIEARYITEEMITVLLDQVNILSALKSIWDYGDDFKRQPTVLNRNFLSHGMLYRKIKKKDCIMMFLLLFNLTDHLNSFAHNT